ncbi:hypothetical protein ACIRPQ_29255 [Streptomyces sp. NPDC101213]|uniref:hypothetical protein n=1 Tax=Streptomyces sp. NPDC101213 TaxID=3366130 RepID=UPI00380EAAEA
MWTEDYRRKGAQAVGASGPGERGPFGEYGQDDDGREERPYAAGGLVGAAVRGELPADEPVVRLGVPAGGRLEQALQIMARRGPVVELTVPWLRGEDDDAEVVGGGDEQDA